jgi:Flp pilus assembly pilin Flp
MLPLSTTASYVRARIEKLRGRDEGVTAVEYALMVAIIALLMVAGFWFLFSNVSNAFSDTADCVAGPGGTANCPTTTGAPGGR